MKRNQNPLAYTLSVYKNTTPSMRFCGGDFDAWQKQAKEKLASLLGLPFKKCDDLFLKEYEAEHETYKEIRFSFQSEEGYFVPCHFVISREAKEKVPVVLCLQGHSRGMHISLGRIKFDGDEKSINGGDRDFAIGALKRGYAALTIEQRGMGECGGTPKGPACIVHTMSNLLVGRTTIGERVWDISRAIDVLENHFSELVDLDNIICLGNSGGGTATFYASCLEDRIATSIPSCAFSSYDASISAMEHCTCNFIPHIREYFDMGDLGGLIAPKNLIIVNGQKDNIFPIDAAKECFEITKSLYSNTNGKCAHVIGPEGHRFYYDLVWDCYDKMMSLRQ